MPEKPGLTAAAKKEWDEQLALKFDPHTEHSKTVRYCAVVGDRRFDLYVPRFMLTESGASDPPKTLQVAVDPSRRSRRVIGFGGAWRPLAPEPGVCEFEVSEQMVHSVKYKMRQAKDTFSLYVPDVVLGAPRIPLGSFSGSTPNRHVAPNGTNRL